jgi:hypothetical protein
MNKGFALYQTKKNYGYAVCMCDLDGTILEEYQAGDSKYDSQIYGTNELSLKELKQFARQTAREMLNSHNLTGSIIYDTTLL